MLINYRCNILWIFQYLVKTCIYIHIKLTFEYIFKLNIPYLLYCLPIVKECFVSIQDSLSEGTKQYAESSSDNEIDITYDTDDEETEEQIIERRRKQREQLLKVNPSFNSHNTIFNMLKAMGVTGDWWNQDKRIVSNKLKDRTINKELHFSCVIKSSTINMLHLL